MSVPLTLQYLLKTKPVKENYSSSPDEIEMIAVTELIKEYCCKVISPDEQHIYIRRNNLLIDAKKAFLAPKFNPKKSLNVHFIGEAAVDAGGPRKEFLDLLLSNLNTWSVFEGVPGALTLASDMPSLIQNNPYAAGVAVALILFQGQMAVPIFSKGLIYLIADKKYSYKLEDVPNYELKNILLQLRSSNNTVHNPEVQAIANDISFFKDIHNNTEEFISLSSQYLSTIKNAAHITQFIKGLNTLGIDKMIKEHTGEMLKILCGEYYKKLAFDANDLYSLVNFKYSVEGSNLLNLEQEATCYFMEFLSECCCADGSKLDEHSHTDVLNTCCIKDFLQFVTGQREVPLFSNEKPTIQFNSQAFPTANVCTSTLTLPLNLDVKTFKERMIEAVLGSPEFGQI